MRTFLLLFSVFVSHSAWAGTMSCKLDPVKSKIHGGPFPELVLVYGSSSSEAHVLDKTTGKLFRTTTIAVRPRSGVPSKLGGLAVTSIDHTPVDWTKQKKCYKILKDTLFMGLKESADQRKWEGDGKFFRRLAVKDRACVVPKLGKVADLRIKCQARTHLALRCYYGKQQKKLHDLVVVVGTQRGTVLKKAKKHRWTELMANAKQTGWSHHGNIQLAGARNQRSWAQVKECYQVLSSWDVDLNALPTGSVRYAGSLRHKLQVIVKPNTVCQAPAAKPSKPRPIHCVEY